MKYFGRDAWKGTVEKTESTAVPVQGMRPSSTNRISPSSKKEQAIEGPSSDMLAPVVRVTHNFDSQMLSYQSISLAEGWQLGPWESAAVEHIDKSPVDIDLEEEKIESSSPKNMGRKGSNPVQSNFVGPIFLDKRAHCSMSFVSIVYQ